MANYISGIIKTIDPAVTMTGKTGQPYTKQRIVLDCTTHDPFTGERSKYENIVPLEFFGDKAGALAQHQAGDIVKVYFTVKGRPYQRKDNGATDYYVSLDPYKIEPIGAAHQQAVSPIEKLKRSLATTQTHTAYYGNQQAQPQQPQQGFAPSSYPQQPAQQGGYNDLPY